MTNATEKEEFAAGTQRGYLDAKEGIDCRFCGELVDQVMHFHSSFAGGYYYGYTNFIDCNEEEYEDARTRFCLRKSL